MAFVIMVNVAFVGRVDLDGASRLAVGADSPDGLKKRIDGNVGADHRRTLASRVRTRSSCLASAKQYQVERIRHRSTPVIARAGACLPAMATSL